MYVELLFQVILILKLYILSKINAQYTKLKKTDYFKTLKNFQVIQIPPNPIENIWGVISRRMNINPTWDIEQFRGNIISNWEYYMGKENFFLNLSKSMNERFMNLIGMEGHWTNY